MNKVDAKDITLQNVTHPQSLFYFSKGWGRVILVEIDFLLQFDDRLLA